MARKEPNILASLAAGRNVPLPDLAKVRAALRAIVRDFGIFDRHCKKAEYTDTGEAWEVLERMKQRALDALKQLEG